MFVRYIIQNLSCPFVRAAVIGLGCSIYPALSDTVCGIFLCVLLYLLFVLIMENW